MDSSFVMNKSPSLPAQWLCCVAIQSRGGVLFLFFVTGSQITSGDAIRSWKTNAEAAVQYLTHKSLSPCVSGWSSVKGAHI